MQQEEIIKDIRKRCRMAMNGVISTSMREKGLSYKLNFGLTIQQIKELSSRYKQDQELAQALWIADTRELKILATFLYPISEFSIDTANKWVQEIPTQEIREQVCLNLFQELPWATDIAKEWSNNTESDIRTTGYWLATRLLLTKKFKEEASINLFKLYIWDDIISENTSLRNAASLVLKQIVRKSKEEANIILNQLLPYKENINPIKAEAYNGIAFEIEFIYH